MRQLILPASACWEDDSGAVFIALVDTGAGQNGAVNAGIGRTGADGASAGISRIGGSAGTDVVYETGDGIGV